MDEGHQPKTEMNGQKGSNPRREIIQKGASQSESILWKELVSRSGFEPGTLALKGQTSAITIE